MPPTRVYLVNFEAKTEGVRSAMEHHLRQYRFANPLPGTWLVQTEEGRGSVADSLSRLTRDGDSLVVFELAGESFWKDVHCNADTVKAWKRAIRESEI